MCSCFSQLSVVAHRARAEAEMLKQREAELWEAAKQAGHQGDTLKEIDAKLQQMETHISQRSAVVKQEE